MTAPIRPEIREAIDALILAGQSYRAVADRLNAEGILRESGTPWSLTAVFQATSPAVRQSAREARPREQGAPSPEQIREACLAIQRGWTDNYRRSRERGHSVVGSEPYEIPEVTLAAIRDARR